MKATRVVYLCFICMAAAAVLLLPGSRLSAESGSEVQASKPDATSWKSIDDLPANVRSHVDALYAARSRKFTALDDKIEKFSVSKLTVPEAVAELSNQANVICGIEVVPWQSNSTELKSVVLPQVSLSVENTTPRRILDKLISLDRTFVWVEDSGIANVVMRSAYKSPTYPFNLTIDEFSVAGSPYSNAFIGEPHVWGLFQLPQVSPALPIGISGKWPTKFEPQVTLDEHGVCVRKIVNDVARQVGMSWSLVWHDAPGSTSGKSGAMFWMIPKVWVGLSADWKGTDADEADGDANKPKFTDGLPEMRSTVLFTIPWGDSWGNIKYAPVEQLSEADYRGPSAMLVDTRGGVYIFDAWQRRLQRFGPKGQWVAGAQLQANIGEIECMVLGSATAGDDATVVVADNAGYIASIDKMGKTADAARTTQMLKGVIARGTTVHRIGASSPGGIFVEESGIGDRLPYVRYFDLGGVYDHRIEVVDLVYSSPYYYGLALDRTASALYTNPESGSLILLEIDAGAGGGVVRKEIPINIPQIKDNGSRWHLIGAGRLYGSVFYLSKSYPMSAGAEVYAVTEKGDVVGVAKVGIAGQVDSDSYLKHWRHLTSVAWNGDMYLGIPSKQGFVIVKYDSPVAKQ